MTSNHIELQNHLNTIADNQRANGSSFVIVTELEHWLSYGINSVEEFEHHDAQATHYDFYKEVHGIRPRWFNYSKMTTEQINEEIKSLEGEYEAMLVREKEEQDEYSRMIQKRKALNAYKPNLVFAGLKDLV